MPALCASANGIAYTRLVYIRTAHGAAPASDREHAQAMADRFGLRYEEMDGTTEWLARMMAGKWEDGFVVAQPGETLELRHFTDL